MKRKLCILFFIVITLNAITLFFLYNQQLTLENFERIFSDYFDNESVTKYYTEFKNNFNIFICLIIVITSILSCIRVFTTTFLLHLMCKLTHIKDSLKHITLITVIAEYVYPLQTIIKLIYFTFFPPESAQDLSVIPLSLLTFFNVNSLENWMITPLNQLNLFEVAYATILIIGLKKVLHIKFSKSSEIVLFGYYSFYFIYLISIAFITMTL